MMLSKQLNPDYKLEDVSIRESQKKKASLKFGTLFFLLSFSHCNQNVLMHLIAQHISRNIKNRN